MRGQLIVAMAAGVLTASAFAQTTSAPASSTTSSTAAPAATTGTASSTAAPAATSTTTVSATTPAERKLKAEIVSTNYLAAKDLKNNEGNVTAIQTLGLKYNLGTGRSIAVRQPFDYTYPKAGVERTGKDGKANVRDMYLSYVDANLVEFGNKGSVYFNGRAYLPTGESSRFNSKTNGVVRGHVVASHPAGKFDLDSQVLVQWYNQSQNFYANSKGEVVANADTLVVFYPVEISYNVTDNLAFAVDPYFENVFYKPAPDKGTREHSFYMDAYMSYKPIPQVGVTLGAYDQINIYDQGAYDNSLFRDDEITYYLEIAASI